MNLTRQQVEEWLRLAEAATPGPYGDGDGRVVTGPGAAVWCFAADERVRFPLRTVATGAHGDDCDAVVAIFPGGFEHDRDFHIASRTAVPALCRALLLYMDEAMAARGLIYYRDEGHGFRGWDLTGTDEQVRAYAAARAACEKAEGEKSNA